ncbi:MAG: hypothetical protein N838_07275 [Thiohalocapsa sp. PB-PSB1]|nr:MAG: hypothetical protein N838_07275 [Thiohalocapsa sp. PB-PSB1]
MDRAGIDINHRKRMIPQRCRPWVLADARDNGL